MLSLLAAALVSTVLVFAILALDLAGFRWLERGIMAFVAIIGDRRMRWAIGIFTLVLVGGSGWAAGLRGRDWVAALVV